MTTGGLLRCCCAPAGDFAYRSAAAAGRLLDGAPRHAAAQHCAVILTSRRRNSAMANNDPYGGGYQGYAGQSYAGYGSDIVPPPATPNPRDAADCAFKRPKYPGWLCPLHVDIVEKLESLRRSQFRGPPEASTEYSLGVRLSDRSCHVRRSNRRCCGNYRRREHYMRSSEIFAAPQFPSFSTSGNGRELFHVGR